MRFSWVKMSSRRVKTVEPSCGTNAIGASLPHPRQRRIGIGPERGTSISKCGADWTWGGNPRLSGGKPFGGGSAATVGRSRALSPSGRGAGDATHVAEYSGLARNMRTDGPSRRAARVRLPWHGRAFAARVRVRPRRRSSRSAAARSRLGMERLQWNFRARVRGTHRSSGILRSSSLPPKQKHFKSAPRRRMRDLLTNP